MGLMNYKDNTIGRVLKENESFFKGVHNKQNYFLDFISSENDLIYEDDLEDTTKSYLTYLCEDPFTLWLNEVVSGNGFFQISVDHKTWVDILPGEAFNSRETTLVLSEGGSKPISVIYLRGMFPDNSLNDPNADISTLVPTIFAILNTETMDFLQTELNIYGNINTLLNYNDPPLVIGNNAFASFFMDQLTLNHLPVLPATTVGDHAYLRLFMNCSSLREAPELPAIELGVGSYDGMFLNCTSLKIPPELSVTTLTRGCYYRMFNGCANLESAPELPATELAYICYTYMFAGCTSLTTPPELPATILADDCYVEMFADSGLTKLPNLPATLMREFCYGHMFRGCSNIAIYESPTNDNDSLFRLPSGPNSEFENNEYLEQAFIGMFNGTTGPVQEVIIDYLAGQTSLDYYY